MDISTTTVQISCGNSTNETLGVAIRQDEEEENERQRCGNDDDDHVQSASIIDTNDHDVSNNEELTLQYCRHCHVLCEDPEVCPCLTSRTTNNHNNTKNQQRRNNRSFCITTSLFVILLYALISGISFIVLLQLSSVVETAWTIHNRGEIQRVDNGSPSSKRLNWMNNQKIRIFSHRGRGLDVFHVRSQEGKDGSCPAKTEYKEFFSQEFLQLRDHQGEERVFPINLMANTTLDVWLRVLVGSVTVQVRNHHHDKEEQDDDGNQGSMTTAFFESLTHHDQINQFSFQAPSTDTYDLVYIYNVPYSVVNTAIARKEFKQTYVLQEDWKPTCIANDGDCILNNDDGCILVKALDDHVDIHIQYLRSWKLIFVASFLMIPSLIIIGCWISIIVWTDRNKKWKLLSDLPLAKPMEVYAYLQHHRQGGGGSSSRTEIASASTTTSSSSFSHFHEELMPLVMEGNPGQRSSSTSLAYSGSYNSFTIVLPEECISVET